MFIMKIVFSFSLISTCFAFQFLKQEVHPDTYLSAEQLAEKYGYPFENHEVITEDGYILTIYRIPYGKNNFGKKKRVILLTPGLFCESIVFLFGGYLNTSLAYYLADNDYDVWLTNSRGKKHLTLSPDESSFWEFSWHEIGVYDLPAIIDYILKKTGKKKIFFLGYSLGGTVYFVLNAIKPEYQKKIAHATLFAPVYYNGKFNQRRILFAVKINKILDKTIGLDTFYRNFPKIAKIVYKFFDLTIGTPFQIIFEKFFTTMYGELKETPKSFYPIIIKSLVLGSAYELLHYAQNIDSHHFRQYDFGTQKNLEIYGKSTPPDYNFENTKTPITMYYSLNDKSVSTEDNLKICKKLKNCKKLQIKNPKWAHCDYVLSINVKEEVNEVVIEDLKNYND